MDTKTIAYIVYLIAMFIYGFVMAKADLAFVNWQYWVLMLLIIVAYMCGYVRGG